MTAQHRGTADALIRKNGQSIGLEGSTAGAYDTNTGTGTKTPYNSTGVGVLFPVNPQRKIGGTNVKAGDEQMLLSGLDASGNPLPAPPVNSTVILADGSRRVLIGYEVLNHDGQGNIYYDCVVRGPYGAV